MCGFAAFCFSVKQDDQDVANTLVSAALDDGRSLGEVSEERFTRRLENALDLACVRN